MTKTASSSQEINDDHTKSFHYERRLERLLVVVVWLSSQDRHRGSMRPKRRPRTFTDRPKVRNSATIAKIMAEQ